MKTEEKPAFALENTLAVYGIRRNPFPVDQTDEFFFSTPILAKHVHVVVLQPFDLQQSGDYLHTRLSAAGLVGDSPFSASVVGDIHQDSGGLPGAIHLSALHTLLANTDMSQFRSGLLLRPRLGRPASPSARASCFALGSGVLLRPTSSVPGLVSRPSRDSSPGAHR